MKYFLLILIHQPGPMDTSLALVLFLYTLLIVFLIPSDQITLSLMWSYSKDIGTDGGTERTMCVTLNITFFKIY